MKILGITDIGSGLYTYIKPDSALLVNEKPFFLPEFSEQILCRPCFIVRVCRLGKCIEERFAHRYYDAWTIGLNMRSAAETINHTDRLVSDLERIGFDNSLVVGSFGQWIINKGQLLLDIDTAIAELSKYVTIRMGDMIAVDFNEEWSAIKRGDNFELFSEEENKEKTIILSCKIK